MRWLTAGLVAALGLYLLLLGALEVFAGSRLAYSWLLVAVGVLNVLLSVPHAVCAADIPRRLGRARELMLWLAVVGLLWSVLRAAVLGSVFQMAGAPLYAALGILAVRGRTVFGPPPAAADSPPATPGDPLRPAVPPRRGGEPLLPR
jgi:uncharacterized membrane protein HdeD (DUF308 family)